MGEKGSGRLEDALFLLLRVHFIVVDLEREIDTVFETDYGRR